MKTIFQTLRLVPWFLFATCALHAHDALTRPTKLQYRDSTRAQIGYTFFGVGGTMVCADTEGHFFEVTANGELAWEYINPVTRDGPVKVLGDVLPMTNSVFRVYRYAAGRNGTCQVPFHEGVPGIKVP